MKKYIQAAVLVLVLPLFLLLSGCGKEEAADTTAPAVTFTNYALTRVDVGLIQYDAAEFNTTGFLRMHDDGTAQLQYDGLTVSLFYDDNNFWSAQQPEELHPYSISGQVLTLEYYTDILTFLAK